MSAITSKIVEKYNLSSKMDNCRIAITKPPKSLEEEIIRKKAKQILQNRYEFSEDQVNALFTILKNKSRHSITTSDKNVNIVITNQLSKEMEKETIRNMAQQILRDKLSIRDVRAEAYALALSAKNANAGLSCLTHLHRELRNLNALLEIIEVTKFSDITEDANKIQSVN
ncbi:7297_t:CDS:2 [Cetraspora pellucida]|uniref:7297_t:CDS:1 n=1 Tax=Cetraspora pellucida TaxID=1433469 RepID=A0A9N9AV26_9GLOM|nr:7297_t:CDS:2 [Cetraspora pellucida]